MKKIRLLLTLFIVSLCSWQNTWATEYVVPEWSEIPFTLNLDDSEWTVNNDGTSIVSPTITGGEKNLTATLSSESGASLKFDYDRYWYGELLIFIDDELIRTISPDEGVSKKSYTIDILPGNHVIKWTFKKNEGHEAYCTIYNVGVVAYTKPNWSTVSVSLGWSGDWTAYTNSYSSKGEGETCFYLMVDAVNDATLAYKLSNSNSYWPGVDVYVDGEWYKYYHWSQIRRNSETRYLIDLPAGTHRIEWKINHYGNSSTISISDFEIINSPLIQVNLLEPGSLGTEVLYNVNHIKKVKRLVINGEMNSDDWSIINMMDSLVSLDLSNAVLTEIPKSQFYNDSKKWPYFHSIKLPEGLTAIGDRAFYLSYIDEVNMPSTLKSIGNSAFYGTKITKALMPNSITSIGDEAFYRCCCLTNVSYPTSMTTVPNGCFAYCYTLKTFPLHEGLKSIGQEAFQTANEFNPRFPESCTSIEGTAFDNCAIDSLFLPEGISIKGSAFNNCKKLVYAEYPTSYCSADYVTHLYNCANLKKIVLKSPTVVEGEYKTNFLVGHGVEDITVYVPDHIVTSYMLDSYWYNYNVQGFSTADVKDWIISRPLTLNNSRFEGTPNITLQGKGALKINGDTPMTIDNFSSQWDIDGSGDNAWKTQILSNCDNITIEGDCKVGFGMNAKKWYFLSLPFDTRISDITVSGNAKYAIRYYDGAVRAENGTGGSWKNFEASDVIPAGKGFIVQANAWTWMFFKSVENGTKQNIVGNTEFVTSLAANNSDITANKGWNLVGNPWNCYYNIHKVNFTAPITIWNGSTYVAYSILDDDYAIRPNEAFFVQCPNEEYNTLGFPIQGRQLTSVIESQNAARQQIPEAKSRKVMNLSVSNGEMEDMTRVVLNEQASTAYEVSCDASKFMSMDGSVPQIYTLDEDGTQYAINERPISDGSVMLGFYAGQAGDYTISLTRCDAEKLFLTDLLTGVTSELTDAPYTFAAEAGSDNTRFMLSFVSGETTGIQEIAKSAQTEQTKVFSIDGKFLGTDASKFGTGVYVVRQGKKVSKVVVR